MCVEGMTADKLRQIADYITESDNIIANVLDRAQVHFERAGIDVTNEWSELVAGRAMQEDLRRWAEQLHV